MFALEEALDFGMEERAGVCISGVAARTLRSDTEFVLHPCTRPQSHVQLIGPAHDPMYFSRKNILTHGRRPLYAASRVLNASSVSASSVVARCWVNSTQRTYALIRTVRSRAYSSKAGGGAAGSSRPGPEVQTTAGTGLPLYSP